MTRPADRESLVTVARWQSSVCAELGSPTWAAVIDDLADRVESGRSSPSVELVLADRGDPMNSNVWLRLLGSVHRLVLDTASAGTPPDDEVTSALASILPTTGGRRDPKAAPAAVDRFVESRSADVAAGMAEPVQTNEVMRSAPLAAGLNWLGGDVTLLEVGASAGLNLWPDRVRVVQQNSSWGPPAAAVTLRPDVRSGALPAGTFRVVGRRGCDRRPLDPTDPEHRRLLRSFVWPDHVERLQRLDRALASCGASVVERADAVDWTRRELDTPAPGRTVVFHSIVMPYLSGDQRGEFEDVIRSAGERAIVDRSLAWMRLELASDAQRADECELLVTTWPERTTHRLARLTPHATEIEWAPVQLTP